MSGFEALKGLTPGNISKAVVTLTGSASGTPDTTALNIASGAGTILGFALYASSAGTAINDVTVNLNVDGAGVTLLTDFMRVRKDSSNATVHKESEISRPIRYESSINIQAGYRDNFSGTATFIVWYKAD